jgi:hypothetical protein
MRSTAKFLLAVLTFGTTQVAMANDCSSVIALSRTQSSTIESSDDVRNQANRFCNEYTSENSRSRSANFGASYKFLSATFGSGDASEEQVASKYCSSSDASLAVSNSYEKYIDSIAPGAYAAYSQCVSAKDMTFSIDTNSVLPRQFALVVTFKRAGLESATLLSTPSQGVSCRWNRGTSNPIVIRSPSSATLSCSRQDETKRAFVAIAMQNGTEKFTVPWGAYTLDGVPTDLVALLRKEVAEAKGELANLVRKNNAIEEKLSALGISRDGSKIALSHAESGSCPPGTFVSGVGDPNAHGPANEAPNALTRFTLTCSTISN